MAGAVEIRGVLLDLARELVHEAIVLAVVHVRDNAVQGADMDWLRRVTWLSATLGSPSGDRLSGRSVRLDADEADALERAAREQLESYTDPGLYAAGDRAAAAFYGRLVERAELVLGGLGSASSPAPVVSLLPRAEGRD